MMHWTERVGMTDSESDDLYSLVGTFGLEQGLERFFKLHPKFCSSSGLIKDRLSEEGF